MDSVVLQSEDSPIFFGGSWTFPAKSELFGNPTIIFTV